MRFLFVVAHPDDEILGAGATICKLLEDGNEVFVYILNKTDETRYQDTPEKLEGDTKRCAEMMAYTGIKIGEFPNLRFDTVPHIELVKSIECAIRNCKPDIIVTHHPDDPNIDHIHTSMACQVACRLGQRCRDYAHPISELMYMEVKSATDWAFNNKFNPNTFFGVEASHIEKKIKALQIYENVVREHPHPRSERAIVSLAEYRGSQCGYDYAEAFESVFKRGL